MASGRAVGGEEPGCLLHAGRMGVLTVLGCLSFPLSTPKGSKQSGGKKKQGHFQEAICRLCSWQRWFHFYPPIQYSESLCSSLSPQGWTSGSKSCF